MPEYRLYLIDPDDHIVGRIDLFCDSEEAAKESAMQMVDGHDVELWRDEKLLVRFSKKK